MHPPAAQPPAEDTARYAQAARVFSILFLLAQCLVIIDFAYKIHEYLQGRSDARDADLAAAGWEAGLCSNGWKLLYAFLGFGLLAGSIAGIGVMYKYFGDCSLNQFFLSETLVVGVVMTLVSVMSAVGKGLLPPAVIFAYNTYLAYGAITNNPDLVCNLMAARESSSESCAQCIDCRSVVQVCGMSRTLFGSCSSCRALRPLSDSRPRLRLTPRAVSAAKRFAPVHPVVCADEGSIYAGLAITVVSITWMAASASGNMYSALATGKGDSAGSGATGPISSHNPARTYRHARLSMRLPVASVLVRS
jgi:hypothetical protein